MQTIIPINESNWVPISSNYMLDENISLFTQSTSSKDGYTGYSQSIYNETHDVNINKNTIFYLPTASNLLDIIHDIPKPVVGIVGFTLLSANIGGDMYCLSANSDGSILSLTQSSNGTYLKIQSNNNGTISFYTHKNQLITVSEYEPLTLFLDNPLPQRDKYRQEFYYDIYDEDTLTIRSIEPSRYWAYSVSGAHAFEIRANGLIVGNDVVIPYLFKMNNVRNILQYIPTGLMTNHNWVTYHESVTGKENNKNVRLNNKEQTVLQHLVDAPYHTIDLSAKSIPINIANMKSIMTGEYTYDFRSQ